MTQPLLQVKGVSQHFGGIQALAEVDLTVERGQVRGLIGPNGAGKTTLFDCITGVRRPSAGTVAVNGEDVTKLSAVGRARRGVHRTFQRQQVFGWLSVEDNVLLALEWHEGGGGVVADMLGLRSRSRREKERRAKALGALERCGLVDHGAAAAGNLSIGELRRLELARAIVDEPSLLLFDEPTSGLEDQEILQLARVIEDIRAGGESGIVLIEHHVPFVMQHCDLVTVLQLGRVIADGSPTELRNSELVRGAYLGDKV